MKMTRRRSRDLQKLGDYLMRTHQEAIAAAGMGGKEKVGELPFHWETDFDYRFCGKWIGNHEGSEYERNILVVIPGRNRAEAMVMADHYDTDYMGDVFDLALVGSGARLSAAGADDNCSATATLPQATPIFLQISKEGRFEREVWLLHLTGEEFPADFLGHEIIASTWSREH
jgi:hypothetical protein